MVFSFDLGTAVTTIGALGTVSFALVDATKIGGNGGVSNSGFAAIETALRQLFPEMTSRIDALEMGDDVS